MAAGNGNLIPHARMLPPPAPRTQRAQRVRQTAAAESHRSNQLIHASNGATEQECAWRTATALLWFRGTVQKAPEG